MLPPLPPALEAFVKAKVESGQFRSEDEVVAAAIRLLHDSDELYRLKLQRLREAIEEGERSGYLDDFSMDEPIAELDRERSDAA